MKEQEITPNELIFINNLMGAYITGNMFMNYIRGVIKTHRDTPKDEKYMQNKMNAGFDQVAKGLKEVARYLEKNGIFENVETDIINFHNVTDEVFGLLPEDLKRVSGLISKIKESQRYVNANKLEH